MKPFKTLWRQIGQLSQKECKIQAENWVRVEFVWALLRLMSAIAVPNEAVVYIEDKKIASAHTTSDLSKWCSQMHQPVRLIFNTINSTRFRSRWCLWCIEVEKVIWSWSPGRRFWMTETERFANQKRSRISCCRDCSYKRCRCVVSANQWSKTTCMTLCWY